MPDPAKVWWPPNGYLSQFIIDQFPEGYRGHCVDVGASDGISVNSTYALEKSHGWTVISVEPNPTFHPWLVRDRAMVEKCAVGSVPQAAATFHVHINNEESFSSLAPKVRNDKYPTEGMSWKKIEVPVKTLEEILQRWEFSKLDALCVDVEGTEVDVLKSLDLGKWKPKVIIAESWDEPVEIQALIGPLGYERKYMSVDNHIWVLKEEA